MEFRFKQLQDKLRAKKYEPIAPAELNQLVISGTDRDRVVNSLQRMVVKAMGTRFHFNATPDSTLMEYYQVCNFAIAAAMSAYDNDRIDFSYYCYVSMVNEMSNHYRMTGSIVKSSVVKGERQYASYFDIDAPVEDEENRFEVEHYEEHEVAHIDLNEVYNILKRKHSTFKPFYIELFGVHLGYDGRGGRNLSEIAREYGMSNQRVCQIITDVTKKIKNCEEAVEYLSNFISS